MKPTRTSFIARSVHGLEWICADEIAQLFPATEALTLDRRELTFSLPGMDSRLLDLRTVDDIFVLVGRIDGVATTKDAVAGLATRIAGLPVSQRVADVRSIRDFPSRPQFDVVASLEGRRGYNRFAVENAAGAALAPVLGGSYLERTAAGRQEGEPDLTVRLFLRDSTAIVALRLARRPLHRRAYKLATGPGTLHPPLAAALARLIGAAPVRVLLDPFCGDGTVAIEAALSNPDALVLGSDIDPARLANARANAGRAHLNVSLVRADAADPPWRAGGVDAVVTNPPWNLAVDAGGRLRGSLRPLWRDLPRMLGPAGRLCVVTDADLDAPQMLHRLGYATTLRTQIRLAGRVSHLILAAPPGHEAPALPAGQAAWRDRALAAGVVTEEGF